MFSGEYCEILKNSFFIEHLRCLLLKIALLKIFATFQEKIR